MVPAGTYRVDPGSRAMRMRLALPQPVLVPRPAPASTRLDQRVLGLVVGLAIVAGLGLVVTGEGFIDTISSEPGRVATLLALTLALQLFSVQVYGRGSVSVSAIGIIASAFLFDTGTTMAIAVLAAFVQWVRRRPELYKAVFDAANLAVAGAAASLIYNALPGWNLLAASVAGLGFVILPQRKPHVVGPDRRQVRSGVQNKLAHLCFARRRCFRQMLLCGSQLHLCREWFGLLAGRFG